MIPIPRSLAAETVKLALKTRMNAGYTLDKPCDIYEMVDAKLTLQFVEVPTLEGMYLEEDEVTRICVSALRPPGRQRLTAAHELGHFVMKHGTRVDAVADLRERAREDSIEERTADLFAFYTLMPARTVQIGFRLRGLDPTQPQASHVYAVANWLGVGYETLLQHMRFSLNLIQYSRYERLLRLSVKKIKSDLLGSETINDVFAIDGLWNGCHLHAQVGDYIRGINGDACPLLTSAGVQTYRASACGAASVGISDGAEMRLSVCRQNYAGFYKYRYLPEAVEWQ